jgi:hypothetical protein
MASEDAEMQEESLRGCWDGSETSQDDLDWLYRTHRIPPQVKSRLPDEEIEPEPKEGEHVVFLTHFERGFGLPASPFFRYFLEILSLQPHHLPANAILMLSCFAAYCEAYLGIWPLTDLRTRYYYLRRQVIPNPTQKIKDLVDCGAASIIARTNSGFPKISGLESCRKWQRSFFYVSQGETPEGTDEERSEDFINLPEYEAGPPTEFSLWNTCIESEETTKMHDVLTGLTEKLTADDILCSWISRRICPLQWRVHKMCFYNGLLDPTRTSIFPLNQEGVYRRVMAIARSQMTAKWSWGLRAAHRKRPAAVVRSREPSPPNTVYSLPGILPILTCFPFVHFSVVHPSS